MNLLRNGLGDRSREKKIGLWIAGISGFLFLSFFLAPSLLDEGSVPMLSGRANAFDYATEDDFGSWGNQQTNNHSSAGHDQSQHGTFSWMELDPYTGFIYAFGDLNCHNKHERSWEINGNQMPVCTRDLGIFFGAFLGGLLFAYRGHNRWTIRDSFLSVFPDEKMTQIYLNDYRLKVVLGFRALAIIPISLDGGIQMLTSYESTNIMRVLTGTPFGFFLFWFFAASLASRPAKFDFEASDVILPANAKLAMKQDSEE